MTTTTKRAELSSIEIIKFGEGQYMARRTVDGYECNGNLRSSAAYAKQSLAKVVRAMLYV